MWFHSPMLCMYTWKQVLLISMGLLFNWVFMGLQHEYKNKKLIDAPTGMEQWGEGVCVCRHTDFFPHSAWGSSCPAHPAEERILYMGRLTDGKIWYILADLSWITVTCCTVHGVVFGKCLKTSMRLKCCNTIAGVGYWSHITPPPNTVASLAADLVLGTIQNSGLNL